MKKFSIAIFGNTNNYPFLLAQGLIQNGHSVRLILNRKDPLHRPESRYPNWIKKYPGWIIDCSNILDENIAFETADLKEAIHYLNHNIDYAILNDVGPAFASYLKISYAVLLTGSDLAFYADYDSLSLQTKMWSPEFKRSFQGRRYLRAMADMISRQRGGILGAEVVCYGQRGLIPKGDRILDSIGISDERRLMLHFSNTIDLHAKPMAKNAEMIVLCGSRIVYLVHSNPGLSAIDFKGTDVLLKGFALYCRQGGRGILRLPRKGQDLDAAIGLVHDLGIQNQVQWLDEMPLVQFYKEMAAADLICDQFGTSYPGMVTTDAYALGRPVMANFRSDIFKQRFPEPFPGFDADTPEKIAAHLVKLDNDRSLLAEMGLRSRAYAEAYLSPSSMAKQLINNIL